MNLDAALQTFFAEANDLLNSMEAALLRLDDGDNDPETINEIFRAAHTIKGSAGLFGLDDIVSLRIRLKIYWIVPAMEKLISVQIYSAFSCLVEIILRSWLKMPCIIALMMRNAWQQVKTCWIH